MAFRLLLLLLYSSSTTRACIVSSTSRVHTLYDSYYYMHTSSKGAYAYYSMDTTSKVLHSRVVVLRRTS